MAWRAVLAWTVMLGLVVSASPADAASAGDDGSPAGAAAVTALLPDEDAAKPAAKPLVPGARAAAGSADPAFGLSEPADVSSPDFGAAAVPSGPVIITLEVPWEPSGELTDDELALQRATARTAGSIVREALAEAGDASGVVELYEAGPMLAADVGPIAAARLAELPEVRSVVEDEPIGFALDDADDEPLFHAALDRSIPLIGADQLHSQGIDGSGWVVAVLDTAVDPDHPFLAGAVVREACFRFSGSCPNGQSQMFGGGANGDSTCVNCDHGTHVSGTAVGRGNGLNGVAPAASLYHIDVFEPGSPAVCFEFYRDQNCVLTRTSNYAQALGHLASETRSGALRLASVNLSLGGGPAVESCPGDPAAAVVNDLTSLGVAVVAASGNDGEKFGMGNPACIPAAISVGRVEPDGSVARSSNSASTLDLLAPGGSILSSVPGGGFDVLSGTSMAAPHVAGAFALLRQQFPNRTVGDLLAALQTTGTPTPDPGNGQFHPLINLPAAVQALDGGAATPSGVPNDEPATAFDLGLPIGSVTQNTTLATAPAGEQLFGIDVTNTVWFSWVAPSDGRIEWSTAGSGYDTVLAVYRFAAGSTLPAVGVNDDDPNRNDLTSRLQHDVVGGTRYAIAVGDFGTSPAGGALELAWTMFNAGQDDFAGRLRLTNGQGLVAASNVGTDKEPGEPNHAGNAGGSSIWWEVVPPVGGELIVSTVGSSFDTTIAAYRGSRVDALTTLASNDDVVAGELWSIATVPVTAGQPIEVAVDGFRPQGEPDGFEGFVSFIWTYLTNGLDDPGGATISGAAGTIRGTNAGATAEAAESHAGTGGASVWYRWVSPVSGRAVVETESTNFDTVLGAYDAATGATLAANDDRALGDLDSRMFFDVEAGQVIDIAVDGYRYEEGPSTGDFTLRWSAAEVDDAYWLLDASGIIYPFGDAPPLPDAGDGTGWVDVTAAPGGGLWALSADGTVSARGGATHFGNASLTGLAPGELPSTLSATPTGSGYWVFTDRGRSLAFGDARQLGDLWSVTNADGTPIALILNGPIIASAATPSGNGYYMVGSDGGIFSFGDAEFRGSMGGQRLNEPVIGIAPDPDNQGYWLVAADGGIFAFDAPFRGAVPGVLAPGVSLNRPVVGMVSYGDGYLLVASDGGVFNFSNLSFQGSLGSDPPDVPIVAITPLR
ncbi:MAG: S8 family serine peptidase [Actinomycetota bacterium]